MEITFNPPRNVRSLWFFFCLNFKLCQRQPNFNMVCFWQEIFVQKSCFVIFFLLNFKIDVLFPQKFRHIQSGLIDRQFENRTSSVIRFCFEITYAMWFVMSAARHLVSVSNAIYQKDMAISELDLSYGTLTKAFPWWQNGMYLLNSHLSLTYLIISRLVSIVHVPFLCTYIPPQHSTMEGHSVIT
mgnify:CR=1 FL=1